MRRFTFISVALLSVGLAAQAARSQPSPPRQLPPTITLSSELVTEIALYLQERPYREVAGLLGALQQAVAEQTRPAEPSPKPGQGQVQPPAGQPPAGQPGR